MLTSNGLFLRWPVDFLFQQSTSVTWSHGGRLCHTCSGETGVRRRERPIEDAGLAETAATATGRLDGASNRDGGIQARPRPLRNPARAAAHGLPATTLNDAQGGGGDRRL